LNQVLKSLRDFQLAQSAAIRRASDALGVSETDLAALRALLVAGSGDGVPMKDLAQTVGVSPAVMTGIVDRLEEQGWIERRAHRSDRRSTVVVPSLAPEDRVVHVLAALDEPLVKVANSLSAGAASVVRKLVAAMEAELRAFDPGDVTRGASSV
jgi:DNA-binding MarR family transcriptional regulator